METHVYAGFTISPFYDPMIAKLIVTGQTRDDAIERLRIALSNYRVEGIQTNIPFLQKLVDDRRFIAGQVDTGYIPALMAEMHGG
jgi:acetyl-CoA carboxylase biotin carboxylase subunit